MPLQRQKVEDFFHYFNFVEYYLELLVRALEGTRMEETERQQSQLEAERKMALQPLKQLTVQYTSPTHMTPRQLPG